jgi:hypothetical protein
MLPWLQCQIYEFGALDVPPHTRVNNANPGAGRRSSATDAASLDLVRNLQYGLAVIGLQCNQTGDDRLEWARGATRTLRRTEDQRLATWVDH